STHRSAGAPNQCQGCRQSTPCRVAFQNVFSGPTETSRGRQLEGRESHGGPTCAHEASRVCSAYCLSFLLICFLRSGMFLIARTLRSGVGEAGAPFFRINGREKRDATASRRGFC